MKGVSPNLILCCLAFIIGTATGDFLSINLLYLVYAAAGSFCLMTALYLRSQRIFFPDHIFITSAFLFIFFCGSLNTKLQQAQNQAEHFTHFSKTENRFIKLKLENNLSRSQYSHRFYAEVLQVENTESEGKTLLSITPKEGTGEFKTGDTILVKQKFQELAVPKNPHQFNYADYLNSNGIFNQIKVTAGEVVLLGKTDLKFWQKTKAYRGEIKESLNEAGYTQAQIKLLNALLLGQKKDLNPETYEAFTEAGLVHILAVSGLHVGILLMIFSYILFPLRRLPKGDLIQTFLSISLLWAYAALVGFSPSVIRAVTMFSLVGLGIGLGRKANTLNMLALSAVILLFYEPNFIHQVGFQLSYAAVLAIVLFKPKMDLLWFPKNRVARFFWTIFTVSLCAQIGVLPISLYYFHQFPGLFLISNVLIVPLLGILLGGGILAILFSLLGWSLEFFVVVYGACLDFLRYFVDFVAGKDDFVFENIMFSTEMLVTSLLAIFGFGAAFYLNRKWIWGVSILSLFSFQGIFIFQHWQRKAQKEWVVFHQPLQTVVGEMNKNNWKLYAGISNDSLQKIYWVQNLEKESSAEIAELDSLQNLYEFDGKTIWCPTEKWRKLKLKNFSPEIVLLRNSPKLNLERFLKIYHPQKVIADGSNYYSYIDRWEATCKEFKIDFHATKDDGAYVIKGYGSSD
jgi:competence protein ComEC